MRQIAMAVDKTTVSGPREINCSIAIAAQGKKKKRDFCLHEPDKAGMLPGSMLASEWLEAREGPQSQPRR
jgi:hypothetical protein